MAASLHHATGAILNVSMIVEFFGGPDEVSFAFKKHGLVQLTPFAVKQWMHRQRIPLHRQLDLQTLAKKQGRAFDLSRYFLNEYKVLPKRKKRPNSKPSKKRSLSVVPRTKAKPGAEAR
jgi:hypothetical protein